VAPPDLWFISGPRFFSERSQLRFQTRSPETLADTMHGRTDTRFPRCCCQLRDTLVRNIRLHCVRRKGMVCGRTFSSYELPFSIPSFQVSQKVSEFLGTATLDVVPSPSGPSENEGIHSGPAGFGNYVNTSDCMLLSKGRIAVSLVFSDSLVCTSKKVNAACVNRRIVLSAFERHECRT
jgi:hypothetical protein